MVTVSYYVAGSFIGGPRITSMSTRGDTMTHDASAPLRFHLPVHSYQC